MSRDTRFVTWLVVVGVLVGMLVALLALAPIKEDHFLINRRTGQITFTRAYLGIECTRIRLYHSAVDRLAGIQGLTAPDENVVMENVVWRCWPPAWRSVKIEPHGTTLMRAQEDLFYFDEAVTKTSPLPTEVVDRLVRERLALWNSPDLDRDPERVLAPIREENKVLLKDHPSP